MSDQDAYRVVRDDDFGEFHREVNRLINEGWIPLGGIAVISESYANGETRVEAERRFYQAMIRYQAMTPPMPTPADPMVPTAEEIGLWNGRHSGTAIKSYRKRTGAGLKEAVEALRGAAYGGAPE